MVQKNVELPTSIRGCDGGANHWWQAAAAPDQGKITRLAHDLDALAFPEDEIEIEREMLQALIDSREARLCD
jgi:hypothetical protein